MITTSQNNKTYELQNKFCSRVCNPKNQLLFPQIFTRPPYNTNRYYNTIPSYNTISFLNQARWGSWQDVGMLHHMKFQKSPLLLPRVYNVLTLATTAKCYGSSHSKQNQVMWYQKCWGAIE